VTSTISQSNKQLQASAAGRHLRWKQWFGTWAEWWSEWQEIDSSECSETSRCHRTGSPLYLHTHTHTLHCVSKNRTPKTRWHNFIKIGPLWMIFHRMHWHSDWLHLKAKCKAGSSRPRIARTKNINLFDELVYSQDTPQSYNTVI